jgi:thioester reductase-like protein
MVLQHLAAFASGLGGVIIGAGIIVVWLRQTLADYAALKRKVEDNLEWRLNRLEASASEQQKLLVDFSRRLLVAEGRLEPLNGGLLNQQVRQLAQQLDGVLVKLDRCVENGARQDERLQHLQALCADLSRHPAHTISG